MSKLVKFVVIPMAYAVYLSGWCLLHNIGWICMSMITTLAGLCEPFSSFACQKVLVHSDVHHPSMQYQCQTTGSLSVCMALFLLTDGLHAAFTVCVSV